MLKKSAFLISILSLLILSSLTVPETAQGQSVEAAARAGDLSNRYRTVSNITTGKQSWMS